MSKRNLLRFAPYLLAIIIGCLLYWIACITIDINFKSLLINLSSSFIVIPLLLVTYEQIQKRSNNKLNVALHEYIKMQVDTYLLSILNQLNKSIKIYNESALTQSAVNALLQLDYQSLKKQLDEVTLLGFQIKKKWDYNLQPIEKIVENPYLLKFLDNELLITLVEIIKTLKLLRKLQLSLDSNKFHLSSDQTKNSSYVVVKGDKINPINAAYPERFLLFEKLDAEHQLVIDFGDFSTNVNVDDLTKLYTHNSDFAKIYASVIEDLLRNVKHWLDITGGEILIDDLVFRFTNDEISASSSLAK